MDQSNQTNSYTEFFYKAFRNILLVSIPLVIISALILSLPHSIAIDTSSVDKLELSLPVSCTLSSKIDTAHSTTILNGTNKEDIGKTTLTTFCNDQNGYIVYAIGATNNIEGLNVLTNNANDGNNNYDIETGTATSGNKSNWSMKLGTNNIGNIINNSDETVATNQSGDTPILEPDYNNIYGLVPDDWTKIASKNAGTVNSESGSSFTTTYAVYTSPTQPAGTYSGQVKYVMLHPSNSNKPMTLAQAYQNAGKSKITVTDPITGESGEYYKMQDMTTAICNTANVIGEASQLQLVDIRDNKLYYATKLLDGHCWMTQNLAYSITKDNNDNIIPLTSEDTDLNDTTSPVYQNGYKIENNIIYWTPIRATIDFSGSNMNSWIGSVSSPYSAKKLDDPGTGHNSWGNYYNWTAAIASNNSTAFSTSTYDNITNNPKNSICPKGWRLPIITSYSIYEPGDNDFANLNYYYNKSTTIISLKQGPIYLVSSGSIYNNNLNDAETHYLSSTLANSNNQYSLRLAGNSLQLDSFIYVNGNYASRTPGMAIRCLAK